MYSANFFVYLFIKRCIMKGKDIKDVLAKYEIAQAEIARLLGLTPNNLNNMLAKDDVRTGLLESIAEAANIPISVFYGDSYTVCNNTGATAINNSTATASDSRLVDLLLSKDNQLTMAMNQTSKAQAQTDKAQEQMDRILDKYLGKGSK